MTPAERIAALELEFTRLKERQDHLDRVLQGDPEAWSHLTRMIPTGEWEIIIDKPVGEARQGALAMATIVKTLASLAEEAPAVQVKDPLDQVNKKRGEKLAAARAAQA